MANLFLMPRKIINGVGALDSSADILSLQGKKAFVVTDGMMIKLGNCKKVTDVLQKAGIAYSLYPEVNSEPTDILVMNGVKRYENENCDFLIALGGGSPIDTMKAIGMIIKQGGIPSDYMHKKITAELPSMVAIPTTAGTGSETTQFTIITDIKSKVKMLLSGPSLIPSLAIIDPQFTMTAPQKVTAATGLDALCHSIESYTSRKAQPLSEIFSLSAAKKIFTNLRIAYTDQNNVEARTNMAIAATEAGIAFNNSSVTIIHGMSRPIGALFHIPHGLSNALLLETCLKFIIDGAFTRFADISRYCNLCEDNCSDESAAQVLVTNVSTLLQNLHIPTLKESGVDEKQFMELIPKMAKDAFESGSPSNTIKSISIQDMEKLYENLWS